MKDAPVRHAVEYFLFRRARSWILRRPHEAARQRGRSLGRLAWRVLGSKRRLTLTNLELTLGLSGRAGRATGRACFEHFGSHFCEAVSLERFTAAAILERFDLEGLEVLDELDAAGRRPFLTSGHYGHFELAAYPLQLRLGDLHLVARAPDNPHVAADARRARERFGARILDKAGAAFRMLNAHRRGGLVGIVIDQHIRPSAGIQVSFLGRPAWTSPVLAFLSLHTGAPVVHFRCVPAEGGRYRVTLRPPIYPHGDRHDPDAQAALTRRYLEEIERDIREDPALWLWMHRRWKDGKAARATVT